METRKSFFKNPLVLASLACVMAFAACSSDNTDNPAPTGGTKATGGTSSTGGKSSTGGTTNTAGKTSVAGANNEPTGGGGAGPDMMNAAGMGGAGPVNCTDDADMGCYSCKPKTLTQFLNACPTTGCEPFPNKNLTSIKAGKLPALP